MANLETLRILRGMGVKSARLTEDGQIVGVEFFDPKTISAQVQEQFAASLETELAYQMDPPAIQTLVAQAAAMDDPGMKQQIQQRIDKMRRDQLVFGHAL